MNIVWDTQESIDKYAKWLKESNEIAEKDYRENPELFDIDNWEDNITDEEIAQEMTIYDLDRERLAKNSLCKDKIGLIDFEL